MRFCCTSCMPALKSAWQLAFVALEIVFDDELTPATAAGHKQASMSRITRKEGGFGMACHLRRAPECGMGRSAYRLPLGRLAARPRERKSRGPSSGRPASPAKLRKGVRSNALVFIYPNASKIICLVAEKKKFRAPYIQALRS